jgi:outer membrane protein assembly factor BamE (lipoprotein component of BamABCDE complex)
MKNLSFLLLSIFLISSCSTIKIVSTSKLVAKSIKLKSDKRVSYFIYDKDSNRTYTLSEPPPDAILEKTINVMNDIKYKDQVSTTQKLDLANKAIQLGERTVAVNILRDALFRLSEMNINNRNKPLEPTYKTLFDSILAASKSIALTQLLQAQVEKVKAETIQAETETKKLETEIQKTEIEIQLKSMNPELGGYKNYQMAMRFLLNKDKDNALVYLEELYKLYPTHFSIDEILVKLKTLSKNKNITDKEWKELYKYIVEKCPWRIDADIIKEFKSEVDK